ARDLARNGRRTGAALAAATIALALPVAVSAVTLSQEVGQQRVPYMAKDQLSISLSTLAVDLQRRAQELVADLRSAAPTSLIVPLVPATLAADKGTPGTAGGDGSVIYAQGG